MTVNDHQVGGAHYKSAYQHWDWVEDVGMGWMEACATKYVTRWRKKPEGTLGLDKATHYIEKLQSLAPHGRTNRLLVPPRVAGLLTRFYADANGLTTLEFEFCLIVACWENLHQLQMSLDLLSQIKARL